MRTVTRTVYTLSELKEQHEDEESMQANWGRMEFYKDGTLA